MCVLLTESNRWGIISVDDIPNDEVTEDDMNTIVLTEAFYYILLSLLEPQHGYGIMQQVDELTSGRVVLAAGTLYGALSSLQEKHWIAPHENSEGGRRKEYVITAEGIQILEGEMERLRELLENGEKQMGGRS